MAQATAETSIDKATMIGYTISVTNKENKAMCLDIQQLVDDSVLRIGQTKKDVLEIIGEFDDVRGGNKIWQPNVWLVGNYELYFEERSKNATEPAKLIKIMKQVL